MDRQRIDKWLWHARLVRTRSAASKLAIAGHIRVNGARIDAASRLVRPGDVVTVMLDRVRVLKVLAFSERRGSAPDAAGLFEDLEPLVRQSGTTPSGDASQVPGPGRPDKRGRRAIVRLKRSQEA